MSELADRSEKYDDLLAERNEVTEKNKHLLTDNTTLHTTLLSPIHIHSIIYIEYIFASFCVLDSHESYPSNPITLRTEQHYKRN